MTNFILCCDRNAYRENSNEKYFFRFQQDPSEGELTDHHIEALAERLSKPNIRKIGLRCGVSADEMKNHFENSSTTQQASRSILTQILHAQKTRTKAYKTLGKVLIDANLNLLATEVLKYPTENSN